MQCQRYKMVHEKMPTHTNQCSLLESPHTTYNIHIHLHTCTIMTTNDKFRPSAVMFVQIAILIPMCASVYADRRTNGWTRTNNSQWL